MPDDTNTRPLTPYQQRHRQVTAAVKAWMEDPHREQDADAGKEAQALAGFLHEQGLQVLPRCPSYADYRVVVDGQPAPSVHAPGRLSGPMDADEAAEAFLLAAADAEQANTDTVIVVRPASDTERVAKLVGDTSLRPDPVTVQVTTWALLQRGDKPVLVFTGDDGTVIEAVFDEPGFANFAHAMAEESGSAT
jgi:hypothetical protein